MPEYWKTTCPSTAVSVRWMFSDEYVYNQYPVINPTSMPPSWLLRSENDLGNVMVHVTRNMWDWCLSLGISPIAEGQMLLARYHSFSLDIMGVNIQMWQCSKCSITGNPQIPQLVFRLMIPYVHMWTHISYNKLRLNNTDSLSLMRTTALILGTVPQLDVSIMQFFTSQSPLSTIGTGHLWHKVICVPSSADIIE